MSQEKYVEYYVDIMSKTLQDSIVKSISLQANLKITENTIKELQEKNHELTVAFDSIKKELEQSKANKNSVDNIKIQQLQNITNDQTNVINTLKNQINDLTSIKNEYDSVKHQVQHIDTFKSELNKTREELENIHGDHVTEIIKLKKKYEGQIQELKDQIDYWKLTPAKRKKIDDMKVTQVESVDLNVEELTISDETIKDGGSF